MCYFSNTKLLENHSFIRKFEIVINHVNSSMLSPTDSWFLSFFFQPLTDAIFFYYVVEIAFYMSLLISFFVDVKRKVCNFYVF